MPRSENFADPDSVQRQKIRDVVASRIRSHILEGRLRSGDRLPTENELAAKFGVSRLSVREATKALEFLGVIESKPGRGLSVGSVNLNRVAECLEFHPALQNATSIQLIETRVIMETGVLPHVMRRMRSEPTLYEQLHQIIEQSRAATDLQTWIELDVAFHHQLVASSGLSPLLAFSDVLTVFFRAFRESVKKAEFSEGIASHLRLIDLLNRQQLDAACEELRQHIDSHRSRLPISE